MEWMSLNDIREKYLAFFEEKEHMRLKSFPLVPQNDNSLLLINSGMAPMKKYFTGEITPPRARITTCQKCIRTPDIERVGKTARHGTFFEMLGNFSFGDYFKKQATAWAWEFCTEVMAIPVDRLWVSIYENDDEAFDIWTGDVGVSSERIVRLGKADNFWEHGAGPCGPCSELYFDRGEKHGCGSADCAVGCDCDRFVEFWNLVFTQFDSDGNDNYTPLSHPNIDTGMGLERLACIMQEVDNLFEVDTVQNIMKHISRIANVEYKTDAQKDVSLRVITDHVRSTVFMIGDGVMPSNEGRGYVLRRLLRRAARHGRMLGIKENFLYEVVDTVAAENAAAYPELLENVAYIKKVVSVEEDSFGRTIDQGLQLLNDMIDALSSKVLSGGDAFKLYDTYGFPLDLTTDILIERGLSVDVEAFTELMQDQRKRARDSRKGAGADAWKGNPDLFKGLPATEFMGYEKAADAARVLAIVAGDEATYGEAAGSVSGGECIIVLDRTPFYAESGGQVGDAGVIMGGGACLNVLDTQKTEQGIYLHKCAVESGCVSVGDEVEAEINAALRMDIRRNHTAAHLLQAALRNVLGEHVKQAGSMVSGARCRFDFTHFSALTPEEISAVEGLVNEYILASYDVMTAEMSIDEARASGAMALFGEKYGDTVRIVKCDVSNELCGGTHVDNTAKIGLFKILSESSVAAGVRRIEAVTGRGVLDLMNSFKTMISEVGAALKANPEGVAARAVQLVTDLKTAERAVNDLKVKLAAQQTEAIFENGKPLGGLNVVTAQLSDMEPDAVRTLMDSAKDKYPNLVAVFAVVAKGKLSLIAGCGKQAVSAGVHAGNIVKACAAIAGGGGGGRPDSAMAGGKDISKAPEALAAVHSIVAEATGEAE